MQNEASPAPDHEAPHPYPDNERTQELAHVANAILATSDAGGAEPGAERRERPDITTEEGKQQRLADVRAAIAGAEGFHDHRETIQSASPAVRHSVAALYDPEITEQRVPRDSLTGLPNQDAYLYDQRGAEAAHKEQVVVIFDANNFKRINDEYDHIVGDAALKLIAEAVAATARNFDGTSVYRLGGDEFAITIPKSASPAGRPELEEGTLDRRAQRFVKIAEQTLKDRLASDQPIELENAETFPPAKLRKLKFSISGSYGPNQQRAEEQLQKRKDIAKYGRVAGVRAVRKFVDKRINPR